jgi:hypothetical protein
MGGTISERCVESGDWLIKVGATTTTKNQIFVSKTQNLSTFLFKTRKKLIKTNKKEDLCPLFLFGAIRTTPECSP